MQILQIIADLQVSELLCDRFLIPRQGSCSGNRKQDLGPGADLQNLPQVPALDMDRSLHRIDRTGMDLSGCDIRMQPVRLKHQVRCRGHFHIPVAASALIAAHHAAKPG